MKLRQVMVVDPMRSTMTPKKGTERAMARKSVIMKLLKATRFQPKAGGKLSKIKLSNFFLLKRFDSLAEIESDWMWIKMSK